MNDEWFTNEEKVRRLVGLLEYPIPLPDAKEVIDLLWNYLRFGFSNPLRNAIVIIVLFQITKSLVILFCLLCLDFLDIIFW